MTERNGEFIEDAAQTSEGSMGHEVRTDTKAQPGLGPESRGLF